MTETKDISDYANGLNAVKDMPKFYLGQEVKTKYGNGIIFNLSFPTNGLYISPFQATCAVWYSTSRAASETDWVTHEFKLSEIKPI